MSRERSRNENRATSENVVTPTLIMPRSRTCHKAINQSVVSIVVFWHAPAVLIVNLCCLTACVDFPLNSTWESSTATRCLCLATNHHPMQFSCETFHEQALMCYLEETIMTYCSNLPTKRPYYPHVVKNEPLKPPKKKKENIFRTNLSQFLLTPLQTTFLEHMLPSSIHKLDIWCPFNSAIVIPCRSVSTLVFRTSTPGILASTSTKH